MFYPDHHIRTYCLYLGSLETLRGKYDMGVYEKSDGSVSHAIVYGDDDSAYISGYISGYVNDSTKSSLQNINRELYENYLEDKELVLTKQKDDIEKLENLLRQFNGHTSNYYEMCTTLTRKRTLEVTLINGGNITAKGGVKEVYEKMLTLANKINLPGYEGEPVMKLKPFYVAKDGTGSVFAFDSKPIEKSRFWQSKSTEGNTYGNVDPVALNLMFGLDLDDIRWKDSLHFVDENGVVTKIEHVSGPAFKEVTIDEIEAKFGYKVKIKKE